MCACASASAEGERRLIQSNRNWHQRGSALSLQTPSLRTSAATRTKTRLEDIMGIGGLRMLAAWLALSAAATAVAQAADPIPFKIGISAPVVTILRVWMAEAGGFYANEGLKVEVINMEGGTRGLQVLLSGEIQGMHVGLAPALLANAQGADLRLITSTCNTIPITMFTKA